MFGGVFDWHPDLKLMMLTEIRADWIQTVRAPTGAGI